MNTQFYSLITLACVLNVAGCHHDEDSNKPVNIFTVKSISFSDNDSIPYKYTCLNPKLYNPEISWDGLKTNAGSFVLIMDDPDAVQVVGYVWNHWVLYDIPAGIQRIPQGKDQYGPLPGGTIRGMNSSGDTAYAGPCPPPGQKHTYVFRLYGIDIPSLGLSKGATAAQVKAAMKGHILDSAQYKGTFIH